MLLYVFLNTKTLVVAYIVANIYSAGHHYSVQRLLSRWSIDIVVDHVNGLGIFHLLLHDWCVGRRLSLFGCESFLFDWKSFYYFVFQFCFFLLFSFRFHPKINVWIRPLIALLPPLWRFIQCWRRFYDTKDFWQQLNGIFFKKILENFYLILYLLQNDQ